jgi:hypothetical protein
VDKTLGFQMQGLPLILWCHPTSLSAALFRTKLGTHTSLPSGPF